MLQDSVSRSLQTCDDALARIDDARREAVERAFARQLPPVWRSALPPVDGRSSEPTHAAGLGAKIDSLRVYARTYWVGLVLSGLIVLVLMVLLRRGQFPMEGRAERDGAFGSAASAFRTPYARGDPARPAAVASLEALSAVRLPAADARDRDGRGVSVC